MKPSFLIPLFTLLLLIPAPASWAEVYQWRDADGKLHYSDHPPESGAKAQTVELPTTNQISSQPVSPIAPSPSQAPQASSQGATAPQPDPELVRKRTCSAKFAQVTQDEKSDRSDLAAPIYDWMKENCPEYWKTTRRVRQVPADRQNSQH